uniref:Uncharacterized protein n=1 Tax=Triticum urartu TaxID=4572 RepID=A0A8R7QW68_TRIUA
MKWEKRPVVCMKKRSSWWRGSRERAPAAEATTTHRWERIRALGEGGERTELGGGSARPSHGASVVDSPLT